MDIESLKKSMMGVTSFTIWRDGEEEVTQEEVAAINMMLEMLHQGRGKLTSVSMPKVGIHFTYQSYIFLFQGGTSGFRVGLEAWGGGGGRGGLEEEGGQLQQREPARVEYGSGLGRVEACYRVFIQLASGMLKIS